jgi:hypothetical protein
MSSTRGSGIFLVTKNSRPKVTHDVVMTLDPMVREKPMTPTERFNEKMEHAELTLLARSGCAAHPHLNDSRNRDRAIELYIEAMGYALKHPELGKNNVIDAANRAFKLLGEKAAEDMVYGRFRDARKSYEKARKLASHIGAKQIGAVEAALEDLDKTEKEVREKKERENIRLLR